MRIYQKKEHGFTLLEIVAFIVITGILAAVIGLRTADYNDSINLDRISRQVLSDIRYAQEMAMSSNRGVDFNISGSTYFLSWSDGSTLNSTFGRGSIQVDLSESEATITGGSFSFMSNGLPDAAITIVVTTDAGSRIININSTTGYSSMS